MSDQTKYTNLQLDCSLEEIAPALRLEIYTKVLNKLASQKLEEKSNIHGLCMMLPIALYNLKDWQDIYNALPINPELQSTNSHANKWRQCYIGFPEAKGVARKLTEMHLATDGNNDPIFQKHCWITNRELVVKEMIEKLKLKHPHPKL